MTSPESLSSFPGFHPETPGPSSVSQVFQRSRRSSMSELPADCGSRVPPRSRELPVSPDVCHQERSQRRPSGPFTAPPRRSPIVAKESPSTAGKRGTLLELDDATASSRSPGRVLVASNETEAAIRLFSSPLHVRRERLAAQRGRGGRGAVGAKGCRLGTDRQSRRKSKDCGNAGAAQGNLTFKEWCDDEGEDLELDFHDFDRFQKHGNVTMKAFGGDVPEDAPFLVAINSVKATGLMTPGNVTIKVWGGCVPPDELFEIRNGRGLSATSQPKNADVSRSRACARARPVPQKAPLGHNSCVDVSKDLWAAAELAEDGACLHEVCGT